MKAKVFSAWLVILMAAFGCSKTNDATPDDSFHTYKILPQDTDQAIEETNKPHFVFLDKSKILKDKLVIFIGGTDSAPSQYQLFSKAAASLGYHVVDLRYSNSVSTLICKDDDDGDCFTKFHEEIIFGGDQSSLVQVDAGNSIVNRLIKLLQYLQRNYPDDGWNQFYTGESLSYSKFVLAGHSQGGGHAAYLAYKYSVDRVIFYSAPNDYSIKYDLPAGWCSADFATASDKFYGLMHKRDNVVPPFEQYAIWEAMNMLSASDTSSADKSTYGNYRALYTNYEADPDASSHSLHNVPVMDGALPAGIEGAHLKEVWNYLLGD
jgi:pimeloyl-ACP methyl ester carboxylesterase